MKKKSVILMVFIITGFYCSSNPVFLKVLESGHDVNLYEKYELTIDLNARYTNPFDYDQVSLTGIFQSPSGKKYTVDGFWYEDFTFDCNPSTFDESLKDEGTHHWKIRFTPFEAGTWKVTLSCTDMDGTTSYPGERAFTCLPGNHPKGFIRKANAMYLKYDNGDFYFPVNLNACWCDATNTTICSYKDWIDEFSEHGGNNIRIMANSYWGMSLEKHEKDNHFSPGNYTLYMKQAYRLDNIMEYAASKGVNIEISMDNHNLYNCKGPGENCYFHKENPYYCGNLDHSVYPNCANDLYDCFRTERQQPYRTLIKWQVQRTRYMIARWGYAANLSAWELMNETELLQDLPGNPDHISIIIDYLNYQINVIGKADIYHHLVTVSGGGEMQEAGEDMNSRAGFQYQMFRLPGIDFVCQHKYSVNTAANSNNFKPERLPAYIGEQIGKSLMLFHKPVVIDESIWGSRYEYPENDPKGFLCHNVLWTSVFSGSMGSASPWDWGSIVLRTPAPYNKYFCPAYLEQIGSLSAYMKNMKLLDQSYVPSRTPDDNAPYRGYFLTGGTRIYGYIQNKEYDWENLYLKHRQFLFDTRVPDTPPAGYFPARIPGNSACKIPVGTPGSYRITFYTCDREHRNAGSSTYQSKREHRQDFIELQLPQIDWDITFVAELQKP